MNAPANVRKLKSPGPIADAFVKSNAFIKICIGPVGSGKTIAGLQCGLVVAAKQKPSKDAAGILWRKARIGVLRESYPSLRSTTLKSWWNIVPEGEGKFNWTPPFTHKFRKILRRDLETGKPIEILEIEYEFRAIGDQTVEEACRGWEVNAVIVDEGDLQPEDLIPYLTGRVGRFSDLDPASVVDPQIIVMANMPDIENHLYELAFDRELAGLEAEDMALLEATLNGRKLIETFVQPGGMDNRAENLHNLPGGRGYYVLQIAANKHKPGYVDRMVHNKPVPIMHGSPVNAEFDFSRHVRALEWDRRRKLIIGIDQGLYAAAAVVQRDMYGRLRTLMEVVNVKPKKGRKQQELRKVGPTGFGQKVRAALIAKFPGIRADEIRFVADPAAFAAKDREDKEHDWILACQAAIGLGPIYRAKSNAQALRNEAIWRAQNEHEGYFVDPDCRHLIKAHSGGYRYDKERLGTGEDRGSPGVADTIYTHIADAEQYAALEGEHVVANLRGADRSGPAAIVNEDSYDMFGG